MTGRILTYAEGPQLEDSWVGATWPEFMHHDAIVNRSWHRLRESFPDFQLYLVGEDGRLLAVANTIPFPWSGDASDLPDGIDGVLPAGIAAVDAGVAPTALCALQAVVRPDARGRGLSRELVAAMAGLAKRHGLAEFVAPVRPTLKHAFPLTPIEAFVRWRRSDGLLLDPWLRVHERLGAAILSVAGASMTIEGTVAEWEEWTGMVFPESGDYVIPGALVPVAVDRERDEGRYVEPNVWMRHPIGGAT